MVDKTYFNLLWTNTNSIDTYPTTMAMRWSIMLKTLVSQLSWDFLSGFWDHQFDAFAFCFWYSLSMFASVFIPFFYTGGALESAFQVICKIWTKYMDVMLCFVFFNTFSCSFFFITFWRLFFAKGQYKLWTVQKSNSASITPLTQNIIHSLTSSSIVLFNWITLNIVSAFFPDNKYDMNF